jgi:hypothetical protein
MNRLQAWAVAATVCFIAGSASAQGVDHHRFQRATLTGLSASLDRGAAEDEQRIHFKIGDKMFDTALSAQVVEAAYAGKVRPMDAEESAFVHDIFKSVHQEQMTALYERSMLFQVGGKDYWLPVQSAVIPYFAKELKVGETIDLYVLQSGGVKRANGWEWLFLVEDFQKPEDSPARGSP